MRRAWRALGAILLATMTTAMATGCFSPAKPACAFSCAEAPRTCPAGYLCGADNFCHDPSSTGLCDLQPGDAATGDGSGGGDAPGDAGVVTPDSAAQ